jgi:hypothetical protein
LTCLVPSHVVYVTSRLVSKALRFNSKFAIRNSKLRCYPPRICSSWSWHFLSFRFCGDATINSAELVLCEALLGAIHEQGPGVSQCVACQCVCKTSKDLADKILGGDTRTNVSPQAACRNQVRTKDALYSCYILFHFSNILLNVDSKDA